MACPGSWRCSPCTGVGQLLENYVLIPWLIGDRIGLHPLAVIFALLAFGQLFGFAGVLLALPVSAALLVGLRHLRAAYEVSPIYNPRVRSVMEQLIFELAMPEPPALPASCRAQRRGMGDGSSRFAEGECGETGIVLWGAPGAGKSHLLRAAVSAAQAAGRDAAPRRASRPT